MEDVSDGIKISIQDGVEEDPEFEEKFVVGGKSWMGLIYITEQIGNPQITTEIETNTDSTDKIGTITTILGTSVA